MNIPKKELEVYQSLTKFFYNIVFSSQYKHLLGWESRETQEARFEVLVQEVRESACCVSGCSVLDVGCGYGDLYKYIMKQKDVFKKYVGVDSAIECISEASLTYKNDSSTLFLHDNVLSPTMSTSWGMHDVVFMSGLLNLNLDGSMYKGANRALVLFVIQKMLFHSKKIVVCNFLHKKSPSKDPLFFYHDPNELISFLEKNGIGVSNMKEEYLSNDFTLVLKKNVSHHGVKTGGTTVNIYTDGGCSGNPGIGAWAFISGSFAIEQSGGSHHTTNNKMELQAAIEALVWSEKNAKNKHIVIHTDSQYVKRGITEWIDKWIRRKWILENRTSVKNKELWEALYALTKTQRVTWVWVKGHVGDEYNEKCHLLVEKKIKALKIKY